MKRFIQTLLILAVVILPLSAQADTLHFEKGNACDTVEYKLIVLDPGYESYLISQPHMEYFSSSYYESWNARYVREWNYRYMQPLMYGDLYEVFIDYSEQTDYGLELNYRLYYYFKFFEKENGVRLIPGKVL